MSWGWKIWSNEWQPTVLCCLWLCCHDVLGETHVYSRCDVVGCRGVGKYGVTNVSLLFYVAYGCVVIMY